MKLIDNKVCISKHEILYMREVSPAPEPLTKIGFKDNEGRFTTEIEVELTLKAIYQKLSERE